MHKIKRILELNLQRENAPFTISFVIHLRLTWATSCEKGPDDIFCPFLGFKLFCSLHSPNNMMEVMKVRK